MASSVWSDLGLAWASFDRPPRDTQLAQALLRWDVLPTAARGALRQLVLGLGKPSEEMARELEAVRLVSIGETGRCVPVYSGAGLVALDELRRVLSPTGAAALLAWYRRGLFGLRKTYNVFEAERARDGLTTFADLARQQLVEQRERSRFRSTLRGWAVARLVEEAASVVAVVDEDDGPTTRWQAGTR